jgi:hypothetical protein
MASIGSDETAPGVGIAFGIALLIGARPTSAV